MQDEESVPVLKEHKFYFQGMEMIFYCAHDNEDAVDDFIQLKNCLSVLDKRKLKVNKRLRKKNENQ